MLEFIIKFLKILSLSVLTIIGNIGKNEKIINSDVLLKLKIDKISINHNIYNKNSDLNDIDQNIIILNESDYPDKKGGTVMLGAHSGVGKIAYFNNLSLLDKGDVIKIIYKDKEYLYKIINKYLDKKDGSISINYQNMKKRLILYTCNPNDKNNFLVIVSENI